MSFVRATPGSVTTGWGSVVAERRKRPSVRPCPAFWWRTRVSVVSSPRPTGSAVSTTRRWSMRSAARSAHPPPKVRPSMAASALSAAPGPASGVEAVAWRSGMLRPAALGLGRSQQRPLAVARKVTRVPPAHRLLLHVREECAEAVEVPGEVGIELVVVALRAADRRPQPDGGGIPHAVGEVDGPVLLRLGPALLGRLQEPVVAGRDPLLL